MQAGAEMRSRIIKPDFFVNEDLAEIGPHGMLLFAGLWCAADREGRLEDRPARLKARLFPYFDCNVEKLLGQLEGKGFISRYEVDGHRYIQVVNFAKHQKVHIREAESVIPVEPDLGSAKAVPRHDLGVPLSYLESESIEVEVEEEREVEEETPNLQEGDARGNQCKTLIQIEPDGFDEFYDAYPRKEARKDAYKAWCQLKPSVDLKAEIITNVTQRRQCGDWVGRDKNYIPLPASYLRGQRWLDESSTMAARNGNPTRDALSRVMAKFEREKNGEGD